MGPWTCIVALKWYWSEGAFGPFQFKQPSLGLGLVVGPRTCSGALDLHWGFVLGLESCIVALGLRNLVFLFLWCTIQVRGPTTSPQPHRRLFTLEGAEDPFAPRQFQSPNTSPKLQYKSKVPWQAQGPTTIPQPQRRLFKLEGAEGPVAPIQIHSPSTSPRPHYKSKATLQARAPKEAV